MKYIYLKEAPLLRIGSALLIGTILGIKWPIPFLFGPIIFFTSFLLLLSIILRSYYKAKLLRTQVALVSLTLFTATILLAYTLTLGFQQKAYATHYAKHTVLNIENNLTLSIQSPVSIKARSVKFIAKVDGILQEGATISTSGKLIVYLEKDSLSSQLHNGNQILVKALPQEIQAIKNPHEFDYRTYLLQENITQSIYVPSNKWIYIPNHTIKSRLGGLTIIQNYLKQVLEEYVEVEANEVANAILIGNKDLLDASTKQLYAGSGAMHILAVSGLHVGIVYLVFYYLFIFLDKTRFKTLKPFLILILLWSYAMITGASPSVLRATTMFTFITIGTSIKQHVNIYNMIAASAFVLILVNPYVLLALGFQLSYLAVLGIIYLQGKIYKLMVVNNYILDKIWAITSVSIAAQFATFPLGLLYFKQFPNYFLISNLLVIPAAILIVYLGMTLFLFSIVPYVPYLLGIVLSKLINLMNILLAVINSLPFALSSGIHISTYSCLGIYAFIISLAFALIKRNKYSLIISLITLITLLISNTFNLYQIQNKQVLRVYNISKTSAIEIQDGFTAHHYFDEVLSQNDGVLNYSIKPNWWANHLQQQEFEPIQPNIHAIYFANKTIFVIDSSYEHRKERLYADYLIVTNQHKLYLRELSKEIIAKKYIFDSSNQANQLKYWKKDCEDLNLNCYFVSDAYAFEENLNE